MPLSLFVFWVRVRLDPAYFNGDILTQFMPLYTEVAGRVWAGDLPGWNPAIFSGMSLAGDPISGWGYLPAMGFFGVFGPLGAYQVHVLFHLALAGLATYALGRVLGFTVLGGLVAAAAYELGPHAYFTTCCTARMQLGPWIPLGLLTVELGTRARTWPVRALWWGATGAVVAQMSAGYFGKGTYYGALTVGAFAAYRTLVDPPGARSIRQRLADGAMHGAAIVGLGFALSAMTTLPRLAFMDRANLDGGSYEAADPGAAVSAGWSVGRALANVLNPADPKYDIGAVAFALGIAGIVLAGRRLGAPFFAVFSAVVLILTLRHTPVHTLFYLLPRFEVVHEHVAPRILVVFTLGPAMLAGAAASVLQRGLASPARIGGAAVAVIGAAAAVALITERDRVRVDDEVHRALVAVGVVLIGAAILRALAARSTAVSTWSSAAVAALLLGMVAWNLGGESVDRARAAGFTLPPLDAVPMVYADRDDVGGAGAFLRAATRNEPARYLGYDAAYLSGQLRPSTYYHAFEDDLRTEALLVNNRAILLGVQDAQGYNPVHPVRYVEFIDAMNGRGQAYHETNLLSSGIGSPLLALLNVRYLVVPADVRPGRPDLIRLYGRYPVVFANDQIRILENTDALPRAWLVHEAVEVPDGAALSSLTSGAVDPRRAAVLETASPPLAQPPTNVTESVTVTSYAPERITLSASVAADGLIVLSEMADPDWVAYVDGEETGILVANHILRAIPVSPGVHEIELRYESAPLRVGLAVTSLTMVGLSVVGIVAAWTWFGGRRRIR